MCSPSARLIIIFFKSGDFKLPLYHRMVNDSKIVSVLSIMQYWSIGVLGKSSNIYTEGYRMCGVRRTVYGVQRTAYSVYSSCDSFIVCVWQDTPHFSMRPRTLRQ